MNDNTLVSIHGYAGDSHQIKNALYFYTHHACPVIVMSPVDAPIHAEHVGNPNGFQYEFKGLRAYIGPLSLDRQQQHMRHLLSLPFSHFLMNDADSFFISSEIPGFLRYDDVFWSHEAADTMHVMPDGWPYPRFACQPPFFCSRRILEALVRASEALTFESVRLPYIDHYLMRLVCAAGVPHKTFPFGVSCLVHTEEGTAHTRDRIRQGCFTIHAVKTLESVQMITEEREKYLRGPL